MKIEQYTCNDKPGAIDLIDTGLPCFNTATLSGSIALHNQITALPEYSTQSVLRANQIPYELLDFHWLHPGKPINISNITC